MSTPMLGEIRIFAGSQVPSGWAACVGQPLQINQFRLLYSILGTAFGGDGKTTFNLPNLQGRTPVGLSASIKRGQVGGESTHKLVTAEIPIHRHTLQASTDSADTGSVAGNFLGTSNNGQQTWYGGPGNLTNLLKGSVGASGADQGHPNMQPYVSLNFCIALYGELAPRS